MHEFQVQEVDQNLYANHSILPWLQAEEISRKISEGDEANIVYIKYTPCVWWPVGSWKFIWGKI